MYHPRLKGTHYAMGQQMGKIFKRNNVRFPLNLDKFQEHHGKESAFLLKRHLFDISEEIRGITDILKIDNELFTSWMMCMGCCHTLNENYSVEVRGCTAFSFKPNGMTIYGRNNDLPPFLKKVSKSIFYRPEQKLSFILNTSSFINGEEGINEVGLVASMTFVKPKLEEIKPGINSVFLVRYILENCLNIQDGIDTLNRLPIASSCNILLSDKSGDIVVVECNPKKINIRKPEKNSNNEEFIIAVNHFSSPEMYKYDASNRNDYFSQIRYETVYTALNQNAGLEGVQLAKDILSGRHGFMCQYKKNLNFATIWSSVYNLTDGKIYRAEGNPQRTRYSEDKRLTLKI